MNEIRVASFFAGAGGLDLGFKEAGFKIVYASDIDEDCCETLVMSRGQSLEADCEVVCDDIRKIELSTLPNDIDLVVGGPPCQSFSASGRRAGGAAGRLDDRGNLFEVYCKVIGHLKPKAFVFENVRGILATNKGQDWQSIIFAFKALGYSVDYRLLDAADFGVPQHRERIFLVGHRLPAPFLFPRPIFGPDSVDERPHVAPHQAFHGLRSGNLEADSLKFEGGKYSHLLSEVPPGQNYLYFTAKRGHPKPIFAYRSRFSDFLYKSHPDYPMKTIIASPGKYTGPLHWDNRYFSIAEYKAIQGFPQQYPFFGDRASVIKQIGNSVSPRIANYIALAISHQVFSRPVALDYLAPEDVLGFDRRKGIRAARTRVKHREVEEAKNAASPISLVSSKFNFSVHPGGNDGGLSRVVGSSSSGNHSLEVFYADNSKKTAEVELQFWNKARGFSDPPVANLYVALYGSGKSVPQALWNAIDEWVRKVSSFGSLFELYGHFTEPHPFFKVTRFDVYSDDPILAFARYFSNFERCSSYLDKDSLMSQIAGTFEVTDFDALATDLRKLRYDVRTRETNIAIPAGKYMIAYPFTLPQSKQMNFSIKHPKTDRQADSYVGQKRITN